MPFTKIVACLVVDEKDKQIVMEQIHGCLDALVVRRVPVFDSGLTASPICEVEDAEEIRREMAF